MKIALTGNPNSGKTTLYNAITGKTERVGNWAGVTIDKKEALVKSTLSQTKDVLAVDLPGAYSMSAYTSEESITSEFVLNENPDVIVNIVDSTNLSRSLFFTTQLLELGIPVVVALNKADMAKDKEIMIDVEKLSELLGCDVVLTSASLSTNNGLKQLIETVMKHTDKKQVVNFTPKTVVNSKEDQIVADKERYTFVNKIVAEVEKRKEETSKVGFQDKIDRIVANKWLGIPIFAVVMYFVFAISQTYVGPYIADYLVAGIESFAAMVEGMLGEGVNPILSAILLSAIIDGVGAVLGFLPLIMVMFFLLALLEDCGYMSRVAVVMDRFFKKIGLSGKSIIPMIIGIGCAIPGIMATRTIKDVRQRRTTALLTPFIPCGAKIPVILLFAGVFFAGESWVSTLMYFLGIVVIVIWALIIQRITGAKAARSYFIMELPEYRIPSLKRAAISMLSRGKAFIIKAGTIILLCNVAIQIMSSFTMDLQVVTEATQDASILATIATPFAILFAPLGFAGWQLAAAAITGFIAKENVVGTIATVFAITNLIDPDALELVGEATNVASVLGLTSVSAMAYLVFNLFTPPCFAAIGAMNAELESKKWLWSAIGLQFATGYTMAFIIYQVGTLITTGALGDSFMLGLVIVVITIAAIASLISKGNKQASV